MLSLTSGKRTILPGKEFDSFFSDEAIYSDPIILRNGTVENSVEKMAEISTKYQADTALLASYLKGKTTYETAQNIWNFLYRYIQYTEDKEGVEQIRRPLRTWIDRHAGVDCDCMSVFVSSILKNLKIRHYFRITRYNKPEFQHTYVIIPANDPTRAPDGYYIIDGVINEFNQEKSFTKHKDFDPMNGFPIQLLNGVAGGGAIDQGFLYDYLTAMRRSADIDPERVNQMASCEANDMLTYILANWSNEHDRAEAIRSVAVMEEQNYPQCRFFRTLYAFICGEAGIEDLQQANFITMAGLGLGQPIWTEYGWNPTIPPPETTPPATGGGGGWNWGGFFNFLSNTLSTVSNWGGNTQQTQINPYTQTQTQPPIIIPPEQPPPKDNTLIYVGIGALALIGGFLIARTQKK